MAVVVFECPIDEATLSSIQELRHLRLEVLRRQIQDIDRVLETLMIQGALAEDEREPYRDVVLQELENKCLELETRIDLPETVYFDELELYLDVLNSR
jgi:hypothetical protein